MTFHSFNCGAIRPAGAEDYEPSQYVVAEKQIVPAESLVNNQLAVIYWFFSETKMKEFVEVCRFEREC